MHTSAIVENSRSGDEQRITCEWNNTTHKNEKEKERGKHKTDLE